MGMLVRHGVRIHYEAAGAAEGRTPLLLTHGYGASGRMWEPNLTALAGDRQVVTWDLPGHGATDAPDDPTQYSHEACVADMAALLDEMGAERAVIGGMSLGGFLALAFNRRHPRRVAALLLIGCGPGYRDDAARDAWNAWAWALGDALDTEGLLALRGGREQTQACHVHGPQGLAHAARATLTQQDASVIESLPAITVPTLIVIGSEDAPFLASADAMERKIPDARKVVLQGAGHAANMDAPEEFNAAVREFLEGL